MKTCECECDCEYDDCQDCTCNCYCDCPPKHLKPNRTILKCGNVGGVTIPAGTAAGAFYTLTSVTVDTKFIKRPNIKFEFASNIVTNGSVIDLNFQLYRQCNNQVSPIPVGPIWTFSRTVAVAESDSFSFFTCDCDFCHDDCCTYSVRATVSGVVTVGVTAVNNASLAAIVVEDSCCC